MRKISAVTKGSLAERRGLIPGDVVLSINGEALLDEIDYQALTAKRHVRLQLRRPDGSKREVDFVKAPGHPLGLQFEDSIIGSPRTCGNNCVFCFVDQLPEGLRQSLYLKDDDWRLSLLTGNFVTLTNVGDREFARILRRKASPLYISVQATDAAARQALIRHPYAGKLMQRLGQLKEAGLQFHAQIVICPDINDGAVLEQSIRDLMALHPAALSLALVPVGLTRYREGLSPIRAFSREDAKKVLEMAQKFQAKALKELGTRFVFPADELLSLAGEKVPEPAYYEHFAQIENGIGMLSQFEEGLRYAASQHSSEKTITQAKTVILPCGTSVAPYLDRWISQYAPKGLAAQVKPIDNTLFGDTVTVSGLISGGDLIDQLKGVKADAVMIVDDMLNHDNTLFLDDLTPQEVQRALGLPLMVCRNRGEAFLGAMHAVVSGDIKGDITYV
ncbi:MAG: DUF512 domain-containing protein [Eubacteriales bacterium]|nr:DUF512 domain-containing protein [Eubacteriales bacterium]